MLALPSKYYYCLIIALIGFLFFMIGSYIFVLSYMSVHQIQADGSAFAELKAIIYSTVAMIFGITINPKPEKK